MTFAFDYGNRLRSTSAGVSSYVYDGHGRRVRDMVNGISKYSLYSQTGQLAFASDARTSKYSNYVYLNGSLVAIREQPHNRGTVVTRYVHTDSLGTPVTVTDQSKVVLEKSEYEPYGHLINRPLKDAPDYTGHVADAATGLLYAQQRYLLGGFIPIFASVDPVGVNPNTGANFGRYLYGANNPYRFRDPDGRHVCAMGTNASDCNAFKESLKQAEAASRSDRLTKNQQSALKDSVAFFGKEGDDKIVVSFGDLNGDFARINTDTNGRGAVTFDLKAIAGKSPENTGLVNGLAMRSLHEGDHGIRIVREGHPASRSDRIEREQSGYLTEAYYQKASNFLINGGNMWAPWNPGDGFDYNMINNRANRSVDSSCYSYSGGNC